MVISRKPRIAIPMPERIRPQRIQLLPQLLHVGFQLRVVLAEPGAFGADRLGLAALALAAFGGGDFVFFAQDSFLLVGCFAGFAACGLFAVTVVVVSRFAVALVGGVAGSVCCFALGWDGGEGGVTVRRAVGFLETRAESLICLAAYLGLSRL